MTFFFWETSCHMCKSTSASVAFSFYMFIYFFRPKDVRICHIFAPLRIGMFGPLFRPTGGRGPIPVEGRHESPRANAHCAMAIVAFVIFPAEGRQDLSYFCAIAHWPVWPIFRPTGGRGPIPVEGRHEYFSRIESKYCPVSHTEECLSQSGLNP